MSKWSTTPHCNLYGSFLPILLWLYRTVQGGELQGLDPGAGAGGPHLCCLDGLRVTLNIIVKCTDNRYNYNDNTITLASANFIVTYLDDVPPVLRKIILPRHAEQWHLMVHIPPPRPCWWPRCWGAQCPRVLEAGSRLLCRLVSHVRQTIVFFWLLKNLRPTVV